MWGLGVGFAAVAWAVEQHPVADVVGAAFGFGHPVVEVKESLRQADAATQALDAGAVGAGLGDGQVFDLLL